MGYQGPEIIYGAAGVAAMSPEEYQNRFNALQNHHVKALDTAHIYPNSEATLGKNNAPSQFVIHTKAPGFQPHCLSEQSVLESIDKSLDELKVSSVDLLYLHSPDPATPIEETLSAIQKIYAAGKFKRFGVSNFLPQDVQKIYDIQAAANSVLPTVFQGNYNAVARHIEEDLFPLLHRLKISFYAYSPIAGGFLVKDSAAVRSKEVSGRFSGETFIGELYNKLYGKESLYAALDEWGEIAKDAGVSRAALAYRWIAWHSALKKDFGDGIIIGASSTPQLEETLTAIEAGPLEQTVADKASAVWDKVKSDAPRDNYHSANPSL